MDKICVIEGCDNRRTYGRKYCWKHYLQVKREEYYRKKQENPDFRRIYDAVCLHCGKAFKAVKKTATYCSVECSRAASKKMSSGINPYEYSKGNYRISTVEHRVVATKLLGRKLQTNEVVHHLDLDPKNNSPSNLIVLSRSKHSSLHQYITKQRAILEQSNTVNIENCWKTLIVPVTTTWLETAGVKVIKLWEIGQSAAKPLSNEEGSETMHDTSHVDDDIVQTTTH